MPTGSGKTLVAVMLILKIFGLYDPLSNDKLLEKSSEWKIKK